jgi:hypothetical protein
MEHLEIRLEVHPGMEEYVLKILLISIQDLCHSYLRQTLV